MDEQLTTLDIGFLHAEDADRYTNVGIGGLAILDGPMPDHRSLTATLAERIAFCPRFAKRLRRRAFDLSRPEWVDDDRFRLADHVRRISVPAPGTDDQLFPVVADVMSWRLDRDRPLWEIWVIDGLRDGRWAMLMKVHPCLADAVATVHILTGLSDNVAGDGSAVRPTGHLREVSADQQPTRPPAARAGWSTVLQDSVGLSMDVIAAAGQAVRGSGELLAGLLRPASSLNGTLTSRRRYGAARVRFDDVNRICRTFKVTVDDVALAAVTQSYRDMLIRRGEVPRSDTLRTLVPMPMSGADAVHPTELRQVMLLPHLPVDQENPVLRLRTTHTRLAEAKTAARRRPGNAAAVAARMVPFPAVAWTMNLLARLPQRSVAALAVSVPGPSQRLRVMGCDVVEVLPIPPIALQVRTGVAMLGYADHLFFGVLADFDTVPDADEFARGIEAAVAGLVKRCKRRRPADDRRSLALVVSN